MDLGLGPDPRILAMSEFLEVPGAGVVLVDLNGQGMVLTMPVWMDTSGHVIAGGSHIGGTGDCIWEGTATVTGRASSASAVIDVLVTSTRDGDSFSFEVFPGPDAWYAGCRPLPTTWESLEGFRISSCERD